MNNSAPHGTVNNYTLSEDERNEGATLIYKTLVKVNEWFRVISIPEIKKRVEERGGWDGFFMA